MKGPPDGPPGDLWVFGYGSLMWRPGFAFAERRPALLRGYCRRLCIGSTHHRGSAERPGLVLGLDRGGACRGVAFRVAEAGRVGTLAYLREREQMNRVYHERWRPVRLDDGRVVEALAFVVDRAHAQYAGALPRDEVLALVRQGVGQSGACVDYVRSTAEHLAEMGLRDPALDWLVGRLGDA